MGFFPNHWKNEKLHKIQKVIILLFIFFKEAQEEVPFPLQVGGPPAKLLPGASKKLILYRFEEETNCFFVFLLPFYPANYVALLPSLITCFRLRGWSCKATLGCSQLLGRGEQGEGSDFLSWDFSLTQCYVQGKQKALELLNMIGYMGSEWQKYK